MEDFWNNGVWPRRSNASFIVLISKVTSPQGINDFRPISLIGCLYKIVTKILARRIKGVLPKLIDDRQSTFLGGRNMLDGVVVANEIVHAAKSDKKPTILLKVDFEKAYDTVDWGFLKYMMRRMNFCGRWIESFLTFALVSILVNGSPGEEFHLERGIRQGDPLAPFLFLLVAEGLTGLVRNAMTTGKLKGFKMGANGELEVPILQFADDTLLMGEASLQNILSFKCILCCYELASGLKVNFIKSCCVGISMPDVCIHAEL